MRKFEVVYWELNRISIMVDAETKEQAMDKAEAVKEENGWDFFEEETEGTNGIELVYDWTEDRPDVVYNEGTKAGFKDGTKAIS